MEKTAAAEAARVGAQSSEVILGNVWRDKKAEKAQSVCKGKQCSFSDGESLGFLKRNKPGMTFASRCMFVDMTKIRHRLGKMATRVGSLLLGNAIVSSLTSRVVGYEII